MLQVALAVLALLVVSDMRPTLVRAIPSRQSDLDKKLFVEVNFLPWYHGIRRIYFNSCLHRQHCVLGCFGVLPFLGRVVIRRRLLFLDL